MNLSTIRFLVIDDDTDSRKIICDFLKDAGCAQVEQCENGKKGLACIQKGGVDFVISDWDMPGMDGLELLKQVRALPNLTVPAFGTLPFMIVTAPISNESLKIKDAALEGVDAYLIKPFRARTLIQKIKDVVYDRVESMKKDVVVVDDDDEVRKFLLEALTQLGYRPVSDFNNANDAYAYLEKHESSIALVISDWEMPGMTGLELLHKVRVNRKLTHLPFIIISSQTSIESMKIQQAIEAEVDSYLMKPFRLDALETKIKLVIAKARLDMSIMRRLESAGVALQDGDLDDAEHEYKHVGSLNPKNVDAWLGLASVEMTRGTPKSVNKAIGYFERAIESNPRYDRSHIELALAYENSRSIDRSITILKEALTKCFPLDRIHYHLGRLLLERGKQEEAIQNLEKAIELNPKLPHAEELLKTAKENPRKAK